MNNLHFYKGIPFKVFLFVFSLAFLCDMPSIHAQITNNPLVTGGVSSSQMSLLRSELQKRGISEEEAKTHLLNKGIDVDKLSQAELIIRKDEIIDYMRDLEAEKKLKEPIKDKKLVIDEASQQFDMGELDNTKLTEEELEILRPELEKKKLEMEEDKKKMEELANRKFQIYGHAFFENRNLKLIATTDGAKAPDT